MSFICITTVNNRRQKTEDRRQNFCHLSFRPLDKFGIGLRARLAQSMPHWQDRLKEQALPKYGS